MLYIYAAASSLLLSDKLGLTYCLLQGIESIISDLG